MKLISLSYKILTPTEQIKRVTKDVETVAGHETAIESVNIAVRFFCNVCTDCNPLLDGSSNKLCKKVVSDGLCIRSSSKFLRQNEKVHINIPDELELSDIGNVILELRRTVEKVYSKILKLGCTPQEARDILPAAVDTEIVVETSIIEWRHILHLMCAKNANPQLLALMVPLLNELGEIAPILFKDIAKEKTDLRSN